jgi:ATP-binding cassette, subfamily B, bacterial
VPARDDSEPAVAAGGIEARRLCVARGGREVLRDVSLVVPSGLVTALLAPSGAGKSTLLRCLNRLVAPDSGEVLLQGRDILELEPRVLRRRVGLVAQVPVMLPGTVRDNVLYAIDEPRTGQAEDALRAANLDPAFAERPARELSGGERARVALARALAREPEVLLLDEPTENLDADQRARLTGVIRDYARDRTCVVISHDMDFIAAVADRILVLEHGRIAQMGDHRALMAEGGLYKRLYEAQNVDPNLVYPTP